MRMMPTLSHGFARRVLRRALRLAPLMVVASVGLSTAGWAWGRAASALPRKAARVEGKRFPHQKHARLFPECETCHAGIMAGDTATNYPATSSCADCHDGTRQKRVEWDGHRVRPSNLIFSHAKHHREAEGKTPALDCRTCHGLGGGSTFMAVARATPELCIGCHSHKADGHLTEDPPCSRCHAPLARATRLSDSAVAAISVPEWHRRANFLSKHGPRAEADVYQCATCHARESCARCHPNAGEMAQVASLERDARVARLLKGRAPTYATPRSHNGAPWVVLHGDSAKAKPQSCANCHAQPSCRTCHIGRSASREIARLARPDPDGAAGVRLKVLPVDMVARGAASTFPHAPSGAAAPPAAPTVAAVGLVGGPSVAQMNRVAHAPADTALRLVRVHPLDFVEQHGPTASSGRINCQGCHEERTCTNCHNGGSRRRFHGFNFVSRHAASAAGRERDCSSCHATETFCRECHRGQGVLARGSRDVAYHDRQPLWLTQHGQAARMEMQTCASCHQQRDCTRCHSDVGLRVNPHGPGFDAARMAKRNRQMCLTCHLKDPLKP